MKIRPTQTAAFEESANAKASPLREFRGAQRPPADGPARAAIPESPRTVWHQASGEPSGIRPHAAGTPTEYGEKGRIIHAVA